MKHIVAKILVLSFSFLTFQTLCAFHNASRYLPFLERPDNYLPGKKPYLHLAPFYTTASTAHKRGGGTAGIPELWGKYDLKDVIRSLRAVDPLAVNPLVAETGSNKFVEKSIKFKVSGKVRSIGVMVNYEHDVQWHGLSLGVWMPMMTASATGRYAFNKNDFLTQAFGPALTDQDLIRLDDTIDKVRRNTHEEIGFTENRWEKSGVGDIDAHVRWNYFLDHELLMRSINIDIQCGCIVPTGAASDVDNPLSVPFMGGGHWGLYGEIVPEFELKQDLKVGFMMSGLYQAKNQRTVRLPIYQEPAIFSSLVGRVDINPGSTFKISPYLILENVADGLHVQARYTYLRHAQDRWKDIRSDQTIPSYLTLKSTDAFALEYEIAQADIAHNITEKENLSQWRSHYITLQLMYDSKQALHNWDAAPNFYVSYDVPIGGNGMSKNHQVTFGVELHF